MSAKQTIVETELRFDYPMMDDLDAYVVRRLGERPDPVAVAQVCWTLLGFAANTWKCRAPVGTLTDEEFLEFARKALAEVPPPKG